MKRSRRALLLLPLLLLAVPLWFAKQKRESSASYLLSRLPENQTCSLLRKWHSFNTTRFDPHATHFSVMSASWFTDDAMSTTYNCNANNGMGKEADWAQCFYSPDGIRCYPDGPNIRNLSPNQMALIKSAVSQLPANQTPAKIKNTLIITFPARDGYETRIYDRAHLPPQVVRIYQVIGARLDVAKP